jgi:hypothetical protein
MRSPRRRGRAGLPAAGRSAPTGRGVRCFRRSRPRAAPECRPASSLSSGSGACAPVPSCRSGSETAMADRRERCETSAPRRAAAGRQPPENDSSSVSFFNGKGLGDFAHPGRAVTLKVPCRSSQCVMIPVLETAGDGHETAYRDTIALNGPDMYDRQMPVRNGNLRRAADAQARARILLRRAALFHAAAGPAWVGHSSEALDRSTRYFPAVGLLIGAIAALVFILTSSSSGRRRWRCWRQWPVRSI